MKVFFGQFLPHSPKGLSGYCFHPWCLDGLAGIRADIWVGGQQEKVCLGCISETVRDIGKGVQVYNIMV